MSEKMPKPTLKGFGQVIWADWTTRMSGPFLVPSAIIAALLSDSWARPVFWACAFLAALFTVYKIWAVERNRMIEIESRMRDEIEELKERLKPKLGFLFKNGIHECYSDDDEHQGCYLRLMVKSVCDEIGRAHV